MNENNHYQNRRGVLDLPAVEAWNAAVDGAELLDGLQELLRRHVILPKWGAEALALWTLHTYAFPLREVTTYIGVMSPEKRCGKTTLLTLLSVLANRALVASNISPPAMFRVIEEVQPTLLIDEADSFLEGKEELRGILNAGYSRESAYVVRVSPTRGTAGNAGPQRVSRSQEDRDELRHGKDGSNGNDESENRSGLRKFSCWCPKVIAGIGELPETLADRCIVLTMQRKRPGEVCERLRKLNADEWRRKCARFVADNALAIAHAEPALPESLNDRAADIWEPLVALADLAGGAWPALAREAAESLSGGKEDTSEWGMLLQHIQAAFAVRETDKLFSRSLIAFLARAKNPPWAELRKGKAVTDVWLAQQLRKVGITPRTVWIEGTTAKGYHLQDFAEAFARYVPARQPDESTS